MHIKQFVASSLGDASYLVASGAEAAVIDPQRDVRPYLAAAEELGVTIRYVFETHVHNDYVSGGPELAALGATIVAPHDSGLQFPHQPVEDGEEVAVGAARIRAVRAPGHTHHHTAYLGIDEADPARIARMGIGDDTLDRLFGELCVIEFEQGRERLGGQAAELE